MLPFEAGYPLATPVYVSPGCWLPLSTPAYVSPECWLPLATPAYVSPGCWLLLFMSPQDAGYPNLCLPRMLATSWLPQCSGVWQEEFLPPRNNTSFVGPGNKSTITGLKIHFQKLTDQARRVGRRWDARGEGKEEGRKVKKGGEEGRVRLGEGT